MASIQNPSAPSPALDPTTSSSGANNAAPNTATDAVLKPSEPVPADTAAVSGLDFNDFAGRDVSAAELVEGFAHAGFQASALGQAAQIIEGMRTWRDPTDPTARTTLFLGYTSNLISSGLRETLRWLVQHRHVSAIVTTAGGVEEDLIKCLAPTYHLGSFHGTAGATLRSKGINRIGDLAVPNSNYCAFEDWLMPILDAMAAEQNGTKEVHPDDAVDPEYRHEPRDSDGDGRASWTPSRVIRRLGREIADERSVCYWAWKNDIPIFCPALTDGSLGDMLYFHSFRAESPRTALKVDIVADIRRINTLAVRARRTGMIVLGGGVVKHHIANANLMRNGADAAVLVNTGQEFDGSDAGARPDEAVSWGKIKAGAPSVKIYADATLVFPLLVAATFARATPASKAEEAKTVEGNGSSTAGETGTGTPEQKS